MTILIVGDPDGLHSMIAMEKYKPEDITVWEDQPTHVSSIHAICDRINVTDNLDSLNMKFDIVIGNPPYGKNANLAVKFLNKVSTLSNDIRMVLPKTMRKPSVINRLNPHLHLTNDIDVDNTTFRGSISTCIQTYSVKSELRDRIVTYTTHSDFKFVDRHEANICVGRVGGGPAGKVFTEWSERSENSHYFIKAESTHVINLLSQLQVEFREASLNTVGCPSLSKHDLITIYEQHKQ